MLANILSGFSDFVWPRRCAVCGGAVDRAARHVCAECLMRIPFLPADGCCRVCGQSVAGYEGDFLCEDCAGANRPRFDRAVSATRYEGAMRELVANFKRGGALWLRNDFVDWVEAAARAHYDVSAVDVVVPVPTTYRHFIDRGYNPSGELASLLASRIDRRYARRALARVGAPSRQSSLSEAERRENARDTVEVRECASVRGRTVLVVDDVMTTGSTLSACAEALRRSGVWRVWCVTLARSIKD